MTRFPALSPSCPFEGFTLPTASPLRSVTTGSGAGFSYLLAIAYDYDVLGLGPDSPWDDWRCPGTLRLSVWVVLTPMTLLIPAFALVCAPPVFAIRLPCTHNAPLPSPAHWARLTLASLAPVALAIPSFGTMLEPRYVVGARALDQ